METKNRKNRRAIYLGIVTIPLVFGTGTYWILDHWNRYLQLSGLCGPLHHEENHRRPGGGSLFWQDTGIHDYVPPPGDR